MNSTAYQKHEEPRASSTIAWWLLGLAVSFEIIGAIGLRFSEGFTVLLPTGLALAAFSTALYLVSQVMKKLPVSVAYPVWAGGGTVGVALLGVTALGEDMNISKMIGVVLVLIGVVIINRTSEKSSGC